jgi:DNA-binding XRE family transcriptional regulator
MKPGRADKGAGRDPRGWSGRRLSPSVDYSQPRAVPPGATVLGLVGQELRGAREAAGLTQEQLAFRAGVDRSYVSLLEHDHKSPTLDMLFRLCDALGVKASRLSARAEKKRQAGP